MSTNGSVIVDSTPTNTEPSTPLHSLFLEHLYSYPTVTAAVDYASALPVVKKVATSAKPYIVTIREKSKPISEPVLKRATPVLSKVDALGDRVLSKVDENFPQLKETKPQNVRDFALKPYLTVKSTAEAYSTAAHDQLTANVVIPLKNVGDRVKTHYITVYDTKGKEIIKKQVDPLIHPLNDKIEAFINSYLPAGSTSEESTTTLEQENELLRAVKLAHVTLERAKPVLDEQATHLAALPNATKEYLYEVYEEKLTGYGKDKKVSGPVYASLATCKQLSKDGVVLASSLLKNGGFRNISSSKTDNKTEKQLQQQQQDSDDQQQQDLPTSISSAEPTTSTSSVTATTNNSTSGPMDLDSPSA